MARKKATSRKATPKKEATEHSVEIVDTTESALETKEDVSSAGDAKDTANNAKDKEDAQADDVGPETGQDQKKEKDNPEPLSESVETAVTQSKDSATGMDLTGFIFGCIIAAVLGAAGAYFFMSQKLTPQIDALKTRITTIEEQPEVKQEIPDIPDIQPLENQLSSLSASIDDLKTQVSENAEALNALGSRLDKLETAGVKGSISEDAAAAYERELETAEAFIRAQRVEIEELIAEAKSVEDQADEAARSAVTRAAVSRILAAIDSGASFDGPLGDLRAVGVSIPDGLSAVSSTGVPSLTSLQQSFPDAARNALSASRSVTEGEGGFTEFLRSQLGARSLEPKEGDDPDAVLSRAEAALRDGRMNDVLAELDGLPDEGLNELSDWSGQLKQRLSAVEAAQSLSETVN
ncbi:MAG: hypothetical protein AAGF53_14060 [Pseudomonadota bacterium]